MLDALITAGASLLGNMLKSNTDDKNMQMQMQFNQQQNALAQQNIALQKDFAQHGISWKVADAQAAGLHPLAAMGANTTSFSPVSVGGSAPESKMDWSNLGQDLGRAAKALAGVQSREEVDAEAARKLSLEKAGLENDILRQELGSKVLRQSAAAGQLGPPMPGPDMPRGWKAMVSGSRSPYRQSGFAVQDDDMKVKEASAPGVKRLPLWGVLPLDTYPDRATGQDLENEYGEYGGGVLAAPNIVPDLVYTYGGYPLNAARRAYRAYRRYQTGAPYGY